MDRISNIVKEQHRLLLSYFGNSFYLNIDNYSLINIIQLYRLLSYNNYLTMNMIPHDIIFKIIEKTKETSKGEFFFPYKNNLFNRYSYTPITSIRSILGNVVLKHSNESLIIKNDVNNIIIESINKEYSINVKNIFKPCDINDLESFVKSYHSVTNSEVNSFIEHVKFYLNKHT